MKISSDFKCKRNLSDDCSISLDFSFVGIARETLLAADSQAKIAYSLMSELERGELVNLSEARQVGHYWLRDSDRAPSKEIKSQIDDSILKLIDFIGSVRNGTLKNENNATFNEVVLVGIGGSALGPQLIIDALIDVEESLSFHFIDNTDPLGISRVLSTIKDLSRALFVVTSKSGGTRETLNGELVIKHVLNEHGIAFSKRFVAITQHDSDLHKRVILEGWLACFHIWDWVGGRTSVTSAVGLLPAGLAGIDIKQFLDGSKQMDIWTREAKFDNPAMLMAQTWYILGSGRGDRNMVVLPYRDRLILFSRYLQQLVMESLGKKLNLKGEVVHQGLTVLGNKGSTDQHAFIQQLRDGRNDFFAVFVDVLSDQEVNAGSLNEMISSFEVDTGVTLGDYLNGFFLGTRQALFEEERPSITITLNRLTPFSLGALIALFERAVGYYAAMIDINAYDQPGVEAGKKAANRVIDIQKRLQLAKNFNDLLSSGKSAIEIKDIEEIVSNRQENITQELDSLIAVKIIERKLANQKS